MLQSVAFENFGNFVGYQKLEFEDGANFIIGSNAVGKGLILDLIRRCVSTKEYISHYRINDEDKPAYIISKYLVKNNSECSKTIAKLCEVQEISDEVTCMVCIIIQKEEKRSEKEREERDATPRDIYKVYKLSQVEIGKRNHYFRNVWKCDQKTTPVKPDILKDVNQTFETFLGCKNSDTLKRKQELQKLLKILKKLEIHQDHEGGEQICHKSISLRSDCLELFQAISDVSVSVFAKRSIGPVQWDKSKFDKPDDEGKGDENQERMREERRKKKHDDANDRAEILQALLPVEETEDLKDAKSIFETLIYPFEFTFEKVERPRGASGETRPSYDIFLKNGKKNAPTRLELLRVPEGIIEAMHFSLILAQKKFQTICLKEPDKGMHPQMIQKMRDLVLRSQHVKGKTLLVVSHNPAMIHHWAMDRTFVCRQKRDHEGTSVHSVLKVKSNGNMRMRLIHEEMKNTMFAASVLFVEGIHDKLVMTELFDQILTIGVSIKGFNAVELTSLRKLVSGLVVVNMDGQTCRQSMTDMASTIDLPYILLFDIDVIYSCNRLTDRWTHVKTLLKDFGKKGYKAIEQMNKVKQDLQKNVKKTKEEIRLEMGKKLEQNGLKEKDIEICLDICQPYPAQKGSNNTQWFSDEVSKISDAASQSSDPVKAVAECVKALLNPHKGEFAKQRIKEMLGFSPSWLEDPIETEFTVIREDLSKARIHCWENGNLEEVICDSIHKSADGLNTLKKVFNLEAKEKEKYGKKFLSQIEKSRLEPLVSNHLLECKEMKKFLLFLLQFADQEFPLKDTTTKNTMAEDIQDVNRQSQH